LHTKNLKRHNKPADHLASRPGLLRRLAAVFYDSLLLVAVFFVATALILPLNAGRAFASTQYFYPIYLLVVSFIFFGWFWTHGGQTLGLRAWKIKIQTLDQHDITWQQAALRFLGILLTLGLDITWVVFNKRYLAVHERWSQSTVFYNNTPP
jgi:uncharacterized RDD family membrane protein YckC